MAKKHKRLERDEVKRLYWEQGMTAEEIAPKFDCSASTIYKRMRDWQIPRRLGVRRFKSTCKVPQDPVKLGYLAGILDGEGSIFIGKGRSKKGEKCFPAIAIVNTDFRLMQWLKEEVGGYIRTKPDKRPNHKTAYVWRTQAVLDVYNILKAVSPHLTVKRGNAQKVLRFCQQRMEIRRRPT